jgi:hypothetical protein
MNMTAAFMNYSENCMNSAVYSAVENESIDRRSAVAFKKVIVWD